MIYSCIVRILLLFSLSFCSILAQEQEVGGDLTSEQLKALEQVLEFSQDEKDSNLGSSDELPTPPKQLQREQSNHALPPPTNSQKALDSNLPAQNNEIETIPTEPQRVGRISKSLYINEIKSQDTNDVAYYIGQIIPVEFRLFILEDYTSLETTFIQEDTSVEVLNPNNAWKIQSDGSLSNTFYFKIKTSRFTIPSLKVSAMLNGSLQSDTKAGFKGEAVSLDRNADFSQVLAEELSVVDTKITPFDTQNNLVVLQLHAILSNVVDFYLANYTKQGIESVEGDFLESNVFYYAIVPKTNSTFSFDYFNTKTHTYEQITIHNTAQEPRVSTQSDIKPKNIMSYFWLALFGALAIAALVLSMYRKSIFFLVLAVVLGVIAFYFLGSKASVVTLNNASIRIQPTYNSTIIRHSSGEKLEVLMQKRGYYKVIFDNDKIGWVDSKDVR